MAMADIVLGGFELPFHLINNCKGTFQCLEPAFLLDSLWLLMGSIITPYDIAQFKILAYFKIYISYKITCFSVIVSKIPGVMYLSSFLFVLHFFHSFQLNPPTVPFHPSWHLCSNLFSQKLLLHVPPLSLSTSLASVVTSGYLLQ